MTASARCSAVNQPSQFGRLQLNEDTVTGFAEKPNGRAEWINGGFFIFRRAFLDYLSTSDDCVLERDPLSRLTAAQQLRVFRWDRFWSCVDTAPDRQRVAGLWESGAAPWQC